MKPIKVMCDKDLKVVILLQENISGDTLKMMAAQYDDIKKLASSLNDALAEIENATS